MVFFSTLLEVSTGQPREQGAQSMDSSATSFRRRFFLSRSFRRKTSHIFISPAQVPYVL